MDTQPDGGTDDPLAKYTPEEQALALDRLLADLELEPEPEEEDPERWDFMG